MSSSALMSIGVKALAASYANLQTTGHNIANANVAGYSRQSAVLTPTPGQFTGSGYFGRGVDVASVTRAHDAFLVREATGARSVASMDAARLARLQQLEGLFPPGEQGLGHAVTQFFDAMTDVTTQPGDLSARQVVLARAGDLASQFRRLGAAFDTLQGGVGADLQTAVADVNALARNVADLNARIVAAGALGQPPNDLLDQRDQLIARLAAHVQITRIDAGDGSAGLFVAGGQSLVLGAQANALALQPDAADPSRSALAISSGDAARTLDPRALGGGDIAGLLQFQNEDLVAARNLAGRLGAALAGAVNAQQKLGLTLDNAAGGDLFALGAPRALPNARNAKDPVGAPIGQVALTVVDPSRLQASEYDLRADPSNAGRWLLTRLADGKQTSIAGGDTVDGLRIDVGPGMPQAGDSFLLQPVTRAADGMALALGDPRGIAAAAAGTPVGALGSDGGNAAALLALRDAGIVDGRSAADAYAQAMATVGLQVQSGRTSAQLSTAAATQADQASASVAGVNLDEEAARLLQYQQSYQAAAKVLQVAQSLLDTLLQAARA